MSKIITPGCPDFYINRRRYVEVESFARVGVEGLFEGRALKRGRVMRSFGAIRPVPNLITNLGLNGLGANTTQFNYMHLGTGTTTPTFADTALGTFGVSIGTGAPTSQTASNQATSPYYVQMSMRWLSAVGGATGNWTEIGVSSQATTGGLRSHALILDGGGSPTTFTVLADEQFEGTYIFRFYVPLADAPATITLSGVSHDTVTRASQANLLSAVNAWYPTFSRPFGGGTNGNNGYTGGLAAITSVPTGPVGGTNEATITNATYSTDSFYQDVAFRWGSGNAVGTLGALRLHLNACSFQIGYTPSIVKLTTQELIHNQRTSWARR